MKVQTFAAFDDKVDPVHGTHTYDEPEASRPGTVNVSFVYHDSRCINAAHLMMSPSEARKMAELLLVNAHRLDPEGRHGK